MPDRQRQIQPRPNSTRRDINPVYPAFLLLEKLASLKIVGLRPEGDNFESRRGPRIFPNQLFSSPSSGQSQNSTD